MYRKFILSILVLMGMTALAACTPTPVDTAPTDANMPNPASVYCEENGGRLEIRTDDTGGQAGICIFEDGSECDEWAFFRGECHPGDSILTPVPGSAEETVIPTEETAPDGCKVYRNEELGYSFHYPADATIVENDDPTQSFAIQGPLVNNEYWPVIYIAHPQDREEYQIPEGTDLLTWLTDHNLIDSTRAEDVEIAGTTAIHTRFESESGQSYNYDHYLFVHDTQLYSITILHTGNKEDWELYNHFLSSFQFE